MNRSSTVLLLNPMIPRTAFYVPGELMHLLPASDVLREAKWHRCAECGLPHTPFIGLYLEKSGLRALSFSFYTEHRPPAVVGASGGLLHKEHGAEIDAHDAVHVETLHTGCSFMSSITGVSVQPAPCVSGQTCWLIHICTFDDPPKDACPVFIRAWPAVRSALVSYIECHCRALIWSLFPGMI